MTKVNREVERFMEVDSAIHTVLPHLHAWLSDEGEVRRLLVKAQDDGTFLAVAGGYDADGTPVVCFGVGYGPVGALYGLDRTMQSGNWKPDKFALNR